MTSWMSGTAVCENQRKVPGGGPRAFISVTAVVFGVVAESTDWVISSPYYAGYARMAVGQCRGRGEALAVRSIWVLCLKDVCEGQSMLAVASGRLWFNRWLVGRYPPDPS